MLICMYSCVVCHVHVLTNTPILAELCNVWQDYLHLCIVVWRLEVSNLLRCTLQHGVLYLLHTEMIDRIKKPYETSMLPKERHDAICKVACMCMCMHVHVHTTHTYEHSMNAHLRAHVHVQVTPSISKLTQETVIILYENPF